VLSAYSNAQQVTPPDYATRDTARIIKKVGVL
jgi:hypothetical protein